MNRDVAIAMYLVIFGSVMIFVAMCVTSGFSRIAKRVSLCCSRSRFRTRDQARRASNEQRGPEGETEWQTLGPRPRLRTEGRPSGIQGTLVREEHMSAYFYGWYLPYNVQRLTQTEPEPEADVGHEDLPRYEHPPAYSNTRPSSGLSGRGSNSHRQSLDVTSRPQASGPHDAYGNVAATEHREGFENDRQSLYVTKHREALDGV
ncbi:hypothetical protein BDW75DRAFT_244612 [Aspergillus navahoensis]